MMNPLKFRVLQKQGGSTILGLTFDGGKLEGVVLRRTNGSVQVQQTFSASLSLDPLTNDAQLVGREIRNRLDAAGVRERRCVVGLPLNWALTTHVKVPKLPETDIDNFLQIEAERGFPADVSTLMRANSRARLGSGEQLATLIGIPSAHAKLLDDVLRAAQLRPVSFSLGSAALQPPDAAGSDGVLALVIGERHVSLQVTCGGGVAALRTLEGALDAEAGQRQLRADVLARETRITLAQLPAEFRSAIRRIRIFGPRDLAQHLADEVEVRLEAMGLQVEVVASYAATEFGLHIPQGAAVSAAFSLAAAQLAGRPSGLEFLPPRVTAWQQFAARYSSGKLQQAGMAAGAIALLAAAAFLFQQWQLWRFQSQWTRMEPKVTELEAMSSKIRQFRPWSDESIRGLTILRKLTEAFPEDGSVTAKSVEIRDLTTVTCTGVAQNYQALLKTVERLRAIPQTQEVNLGQTRGQPPAMQFTFSFIWREGGRSGN
jgi:hypothetical protein